MTQPPFFPEDWASYSTPTVRASTTLFPSVAAVKAHENGTYPAQWPYGLHGTPTSAVLAQRIARLENGGGEGAHCLLLPSGLAAISLVNFTFLQSGDDVLVPDNAYGPTWEHARWMAQAFGIQARRYDPMAGAEALEALILPNTRLLWLEPPGSVTMEVPDTPALAAAARRHGVLCAIDNTWGAGVLCHGFELGADIVMQALTKYPSGGSDVLMGSVVTRDLQLFKRLGFNAAANGMGRFCR
jgi:cysteine-S-conjugate beta-lyase